MATRADEIRADIEETRAQLSGTFDALQRKADIGARAHESVEQAADRARVLYRDLRGEVLQLTDTGRSRRFGCAQFGVLSSGSGEEVNRCGSCVGKFEEWVEPQYA